MSNYINAKVAHEVLWFYGRAGETADGRRYGIEPGGFHKSLFIAIGKADSGHRARLALGFPREVAACNLIDRLVTGVDQLIAIALGDEAAQETAGSLTEA